MFSPKTTVYAHCDLPCGVYDPAQAKIEALSVKACMEKYAANPDADFRSRSVAIKEERSHQVKEHLTQDVAVADSLIAKIDEIAEIFWATKKA